jgi:hypothetical protein
MYTPSCHSVVIDACVGFETEVYRGFSRKLIFMLFKQIHVVISESPNASSAEENGAQA